MKTLAIVRHAKAEHAEYEEKDFDRKLSKTGKENALEIALRIVKSGIKPDLLISSPAKRAFKTASIFSQQFSISTDQILKKDFLYGTFGVKEISRLLKEEAQELNVVFVFGHNPALSWLAATLTDDFNRSLPTSGVIIIEFDTDSWDKIDRTNGRLVLFECPEQK